MSEFPDDILEAVEDELRKIGLYLMNHSVGAMPETGMDEAFMEAADSDLPPDQMVAEGIGQFYMVLTLRIGDVAWSDRVLNPDTHSLNQEFMKIAPNELEVFQAVAQEEKDDLLDFPDD
jgi:hypothetical protein